MDGMILDSMTPEQMNKSSTGVDRHRPWGHHHDPQLWFLLVGKLVPTEDVHDGILVGG